MKSFLLLFLICFCAVIVAIGYGFDYWINRNSIERETVRLVLPDTVYDKELVSVDMLEKNEEDVRRAPFQYIFQITKYQTLVTMLDSSETVNSGGVGFCGAYTWQYACYERLKKIATANQLVYLTKHKNPIIRVYAYMALLGTDELQAKEVKQRLLHDNAQFEYFSGCIRSPETVKDFATYYSEY